jgi:hypothetical protein
MIAGKGSGTARSRFRFMLVDAVQGVPQHEVAAVRAYESSLSRRYVKERISGRPLEFVPNLPEP